jgi:predicted AAA+ superfamily ATPase
MNDLQLYLETGGFPLVVKENDLEIAHDLFQDILYRDIVTRFKLSNVEEIKQIGLFMASNVAKLFSYATLQQISGAKSLSSIKDYLHYYEASYLFSYLKKFDFSVKKQIMNSRKAYTVDNAIATRLGFRFSGNNGRLLENCIYIELKRRGKEIYYFSQKHECDFLVKENLHITEAIQVVYSHLEQLSESAARAISNVKFDKVIVWDSGNGANGGATGFLRSMAGAIPPMLQIMRDIGGVEMPEYFGKLVEGAENGGAVGESPRSANGAAPRGDAGARAAGAKP